ncbi:GOLPH3/VPS74 family protein [Salinifilum ghardaiensis]
MSRDFPTVPDEITLLLHKPDGAQYLTPAADSTVAAAQIGELVLRGHVTLHRHRTGHDLALHDTGTTGLPWLDAIITELAERTRNGTARTDLSWWLANRSRTLRTHRHNLVENGLLRHVPKRFLGLIPDDRYYPDEGNRDRSINDIRTALAHPETIDDRTALLCALVQRTGIGHSLGLTRDETAALRSIAKAENLPAHIDSTITTTMAAAVVPTALGSQ